MSFTAVKICNPGAAQSSQSRVREVYFSFVREGSVDGSPWGESDKP